MMEVSQSTLLVLFVVLFLGLVVPELFRKLRLPFVTALILAGAVVGPNALNLVPLNETVVFFGFLGMVFLIFMTGLETRVEHMKHSVGHVFLMAALNGLVPSAAGFFVAQAFGYSLLEASIVGIVFLSSSVAMVIPSLKPTKIFKSGAGQHIVSAVVLEDVIALLLLSIVLHKFQPITSMPLWIYILALIAVILGLKFAIPRVSALVLKKGKWFKHKEHEDRIRFVLVLLLAGLFVLSSLGIHPIIGAFLMGLLLSGAMTDEGMYAKIHTLGYGLFVPVFFFVIGMQMNFGTFQIGSNDLYFLAAIVLTSVATKYLSGYVSGRLAGMDKGHASLFGIASTIQLTTTLATAQAGFSLGIFDDTLLTTLVLLSVITTIFVPIVIRLIHFK